MALDFSFTCTLPNGIHARPASAIEQIARPFAASITITNRRTGRGANGKSVLGIVGLDIHAGDECGIALAGPDEHEALEHLSRFFERDFPHCDDALPAVQPTTGLEMPRILGSAAANVHVGIGVVPGAAIGRPLVVGGFHLPPALAVGPASDQRAEIARIDAALASLAARYETRLEHVSAGPEEAILRAHRSVARDPEFREALEGAIADRGATAAGAIAYAETRFTSMLAGSASLLLRERALDVRDVCIELLKQVYGDMVREEDPSLKEDSICLAESLTPGQLLAFDRRYLKGIALAHGGTTSHTVILARSFGIPTVVGVPDVQGLAAGASSVAIDGDLGVVVPNPNEQVTRYYAMEKRRVDARALRLGGVAHRPAATKDGQRIEVGANIGTAAEASVAFAAGAEAIGLFRTEMLFVDRDRPPSEDEQFEHYRQALLATDGKPVIIRTLDVGGDKPIHYLRLPTEDNPFLGYRAVRLYPEFEQIFRDQIRALVRASAFGRLKVMVPMISRIEEVRFVRTVIAEEQARAEQAGIAFDRAMQIGAMIEVPSLAFLLDQACELLDFFSVGTNDLLQYFTAVDRSNRKISALYNSFNPAFLRLLKKIATEARQHDRWLGLCGEMGGQASALPLLVGLGLDEISMASPAIARAKSDIAMFQAADCARLLDRALACSDASEVEALVSTFTASLPAPLIETDLVVMNGTARTKEEAIKEAVDQLYVAGRTDTPRAVENAIWQREAVYSTGFGHGFAIPHCKTDAVRANSLVVLKLPSAVEWGSLDDRPVNFLILLAVRESDKATEHMKVLAALARKLMHEEFRQRLLGESDPEKMRQFLRDSLGA